MLYVNIFFKVKLFLFWILHHIQTMQVKTQLEVLCSL